MDSIIAAIMSVCGYPYDYTFLQREQIDEILRTLPKNKRGHHVVEGSIECPSCNCKMDCSFCTKDAVEMSRKFYRIEFPTCSACSRKLIESTFFPEKCSHCEKYCLNEIGSCSTCLSSFI